MSKLKQSSESFSGLTIANWLATFSAGRAKASDLVAYYLKRIKELNPRLNVYLEVFETESLTAAKEIDARYARGESPRALEGVPLAIKDNILFEGHLSSAGSKMLENYQATYSATVVETLRAAGAIILGRTNMDEFAMGSSTENSAFGPTRNPLAEDRAPGGSSGGSAAAVAADLALFALGSDTGGSIRQPAAFCGIVGLKPTYGRVSRYGLIALASSFDQIGLLTRDVEDARTVFNVVSGVDGNDSTTIDNDVTQTERRLVLGVPPVSLLKGCDEVVLENFDQDLKRLKTLGYKLEEIALPSWRYSLAAYYVIMPAEASSNLARYDGLRYGLCENGENLRDDYHLTRAAGFGREVRRRVMIGTYVLSAGYYDAYYGRAMVLKNRLANEFATAFSKVDAIVIPTTPTPAFRLGERVADPVQMYLSDIFTASANLTGLPAIALPSIGHAAELPTSLQIIAPAGQEELLFELGQKHGNL